MFTEDKKDMLLFMVRLLDCFRALSVGEIDDVVQAQGPGSATTGAR